MRERDEVGELVEGHRGDREHFVAGERSAFLEQARSRRPGGRRAWPVRLDGDGPGPQRPNRQGVQEVAPTRRQTSRPPSRVDGGRVGDRRQHACSPPENARAPVGLPAGGGERRSTDAGRGADERRHARVPRGRVRQGLGDRRRPRRHLPGQHLPGVELGLERPLRAHRRRRALGRARPHLRRPLPGRRRPGGRTPGLGGPRPRPGGHGRGLGRRRRASPMPIARILSSGAPNAAGRVAAGGAVGVLPPLLRAPGAALRDRHGGHRGAVRQAAVRDRGGGAHRQHDHPRGDDGRSSGPCTGPTPDLDLTTDEKLVLAIGGTLGVVGFVAVPTIALLRSGFRLRATLGAVDRKLRRLLWLSAWVALATRRRGAARRGAGDGQPGRRRCGGVPVLLRRVPRARTRSWRQPIHTTILPELTVDAGDRRHGRVRRSAALGARQHVAAAAAGERGVRRARAARDARCSRSGNSRHDADLFAAVLASLGVGLFTYGTFLFFARRRTRCGDSRTPAIIARASALRGRRR